MRRKTVFLSGLASLVLCTIVIQSLQGQTTGRGEVRGIVRDQSELAIPAAMVNIVNEATNLTLSTITTEVGTYFIGAVPIGKYEMTVQMPGFNSWTTKFLLQAGSTVAVNAMLEVGDITTTIEILDQVGEVSIDRLEIADVKDFDRIQQLPLNERRISSLFALTPGVEGNNQLRPRVLGMSADATEMTLDGTSAKGDRFFDLMVVEPGLDTVQEFRIETVGSDARFSSPSTVTLVSRSGTNQFHGSVFWTHRNNGAGLRARRREEGDDPSRLIRNEFGVTAGGPLWLGDLYDGRDKTFWFFSYEGLRTRSSYLNNKFNWPGPKVPMKEWWEGDFSQLVTGSKRPITIYDPLTTRPDGTREPFPDNQIPQDRIHPFGASLEALTAKPNRENINPAWGDNFLSFYPSSIDVNTFTVKADQVLGERDNLSVRWTRGNFYNSVAGGVFGNPPPDNLTGGGGGSRRSDHTDDNINLNWNRTWNPSLLNELLVGVNRVNYNSGTLSDSEEWADKLGLPNPLDVKGWPEIYGSGTPGAVWSTDNLKSRPQTHVTLEDNVTWIKGAHLLQFGGKLRVEHNNYLERQQSQGTHEFGSNWTGLWDPAGDRRVPRTGTGLASLLMGLGSNYNALFAIKGDAHLYFRQKEYGLYISDKWKVNPKFTLTLGLRWDGWTPLREKQDRLFAIDLETYADKYEVVTPHSTTLESMRGIPHWIVSAWKARGLTWTTADSIGYPGALYSPDWNNFGPRIGLAYVVSPKTVIRGSYGEYFWIRQLLGGSFREAVNPPSGLWLQYDLDRKHNHLDPTGQSKNYSLTNAPVSKDYVDQIEIDAAAPKTASGNIVDGRNWRAQRGRSWHVTLEHEVMRSTPLRFSYTGTMGRDLLRSNSFNQPETEFNYVSRTGERYPSRFNNEIRDQRRLNPDIAGPLLNWRGYTNTHTGQVEVERRFSEGVGFQAFYVYTRSMGTSDETPSFENLYHFPNPVAPEVSSSPDYDDLLEMVYWNAASIPAHRIRFNGILDLPFGRGKRFGSDVPGGLNQVVGGWQIAFIGDWRSGFYRTIDTTLGVFRDYEIHPGDRPIVEIDGDRQKLWFSGYVNPADCTRGNCDTFARIVGEDRSDAAIHPYGPFFDNWIPLPLNNGKNSWVLVLQDPWTGMDPGQHWPFDRNNFMGPRNWNVDLSIFKNFRFTEDLNLRATVDFFNFFNHPNDPDPNGTTGLVNLGIQTNEPRTIQLSLRLDW